MIGFPLAITESDFHPLRNKAAGANRGGFLDFYSDTPEFSLQKVAGTLRDLRLFKETRTLFNDAHPGTELMHKKTQFNTDCAAAHTQYGFRQLVQLEHEIT